uniref:Putative basic tail protein n=1 Tax=Ixodes ricinus TaxID=34613 RepID=A0A0K8RJ32_IXORI
MTSRTEEQLLQGCTQAYMHLSTSLGIGNIYSRSVIKLARRYPYCIYYCKKNGTWFYGFYFTATTCQYGDNKLQGVCVLGLCHLETDTVTEATFPDNTQALPVENVTTSLPPVDSGTTPTEPVESESTRLSDNESNHTQAVENENAPTVPMEN